VDFSMALRAECQLFPIAAIKLRHNPATKVNQQPVARLPTPRSTCYTKH
jgi:hypothetical protein